jgi:hypothetical protein
MHLENPQGALAAEVPMPQDVQGVNRNQAGVSVVFLFARAGVY